MPTTRPFLALTLAFAGATGLACAVGSWADAAKPPIVHKRALVTLTGPSSKAPKAIELARTEKQFVKLWQRHLGQPETGEYNAHYNPMGLPVVDFERCAVLAIFDGPSWNSAGHSVESISERDDGVVLRYDDKSFQTAGPDGGGQKVSPYGFFVISKSSKELRVERNVQGLIGGKPKWKKVASFPGA